MTGQQPAQTDAAAPTRELSSLVRDAFLRACALDVAVRKPGNVSVFSAGHRMQAEQFVQSATAAVEPLCTPGARVGARIEAAVAATWAAVACNTNLGILLLCAPLAAAAEKPGALRSAVALRQAVQTVLQNLDVEDAVCAYRAIAMAQPAGLGTAAQEDVHAPPQVNLLQAMSLAADRDSVARQYAQGFSDVFAAQASLRLPVTDNHMPPATPLLQPHLSLPLPSLLPPSAELSRAVQQLYLGFLASWPDSHIVRKHGPVTAQLVSEQARLWQSRPQPDQEPAFAAWDEQLKQAGLNPGTSADLTVASLMVAGLCAAGSTAWHGS
jgi:triphosphoribosyl-dephospho-CoA synthase